jgi:hypothetical protein
MDTRPLDEGGIQLSHRCSKNPSFRENLSSVQRGNKGVQVKDAPPPVWGAGGSAANHKLATLRKRV